MIINSVEEKGAVDGKEVYTKDGTVDLRGRPVLSSKTGRWKACSFLVMYEVFERMAFSGIAVNLVLYLTNMLHEGTVKSSIHVTNWVGTVWLMPILGAYIADAHLGGFWTFVISSVIYFVAVPNLISQPSDQFDDFEPKERAQKLSFFNWWHFSIFIGTLFYGTFIIYIQDNVGWVLGYGLLTFGLAISIIVFAIGTLYYRHKISSGSPLTRMAKVVVATIRNWRVVVPNDPNELHELNLVEYADPGKFKIDHTQSMRFLDKAAVKNRSPTPWNLSPVTQVEQTKQMLKMIPIFFATIIPNTILAQTIMLFVKQGATLNRSIGPHFELPPASLTVFITIFMLVSLVLYDRYFVPAIRKYTKNPRGITNLQRLGTGIAIHVFIMFIACLIERQRLNFAKAHNVTGKHQMVPLTVFILLPQFALMGVADNFLLVAIMEFFYDQAPEGLKSLGSAYFTTGISIGFFLSSFILSTVSDLTKRNGHKGWILNDLNQSRLDYYYAFLAILSLINFIYFLVVAKLFVYNIDVDSKMSSTAQSFNVDETSKVMQGSTSTIK